MDLFTILTQEAPKSNLFLVSFERTFLLFFRDSFLKITFFTKNVIFKNPKRKYYTLSSQTKILGNILRKILDLFLGTVAHWTRHTTVHE